MDLSLCASTTSVNENSKMIVPSKRQLFLSTYQPHQLWSLPDSIVYYILKNPISSKVYEKLIQSCKYFFIKNPILVIRQLYIYFGSNEWKIFFDRKNVNLNNINCKIWTTGYFRCNNIAENIDGQHLATSILPKIFQSDIKILTLRYRTITINDLIFLASKCENINLWDVTVLDENGSVVPVEKIVEAFPVVKNFAFDSDNIAATKIITSKTAQKLIKIPHFERLDTFKLVNIPECFDIGIFYSYIKKNKNTKIRLRFVQNISEQYQNRLQKIVNEIIQTENRDYRPAFIRFPGMDESSFLKLCKLFLRE